MIRRWLFRFFFGIKLEDLLKTQLEQSMFLDILSSELTTIRNELKNVRPFTSDWPENISKIVLSLEDRVNALSKASQAHKEALELLLTETSVSKINIKKLN
jgi:hypothetical protein